MSAITLCDVAPRDGLQNRAEIIEPAVRSIAPQIEVTVTYGARIPEGASLLSA